VIAVSKLYLDRPRFSPQSRQAYLTATLIVVCATLLRLELDPGAADLPYLGFFPAVILATFLCGSSAGFLAMFLSIAAAWLFILPADVSSASIYRTGVFTVGTVTIVAVIGA